MQHPIFKIGKARAKRDDRNLELSSILKASIAVPTEYDFDLAHPGIPTPMFGNDSHGNCVMAGRAHQTLRFELLEQGVELTITDKEVLAEYYKETGGADTGLVVLDSLKLWRTKGWKAAKKTYKILAFTEIGTINHALMMQAIFLDLGIGLGLNLPLSAQAQVQAGKPWDVALGTKGRPGSWGGHYVYVCGYTALGPVCVTWGRKQQITWSFINRYCDEAYAIIDAKDTKKKKKAIDYALLEAFLSKEHLKVR